MDAVKAWGEAMMSGEAAIYGQIQEQQNAKAIGLNQSTGWSPKWQEASKAAAAARAAQNLKELGSNERGPE